MSTDWTRENLVVDDDIQIDEAEAKWIQVAFECWFDVDEKFGTHVHEDDSSWVNLYALYNPWTGELAMDYVIDYVC